MRTLYLDCGMGASGDMLMAALSGLVPGGGRIGERLEALGLPGVRAAVGDVTRCGLRGRHIEVTVHGEGEAEGRPHGHAHAHRSLADMLSLIDGLALPETVREDVKAVYGLIARAEGEAHGCEPGEVHFHEVGALDAVADIAGVCLLMSELGPERVVVSPVRLGYGTVNCAHGRLPVPAPATAALIRGVPAYAGDIEGEMCTPTGAALIRRFATEFGRMPEMTVEAAGCGMGSREYPGTANCLRAFLGESAGRERAVSELRCNMDDVTAEDLAFAQELLLERGALDVYTLGIGMKKGRAGVMLCCLCAREREEEFARLILRHTPSLGLRVYHPERVTLSRREERLETPYGPVRIKRAGDKAKPEYEDLARIARETGKTLAQLRAELSARLPSGD